MFWWSPILFFFFSVLYLVLSGSRLGNLCLPQGCKSSLLSSSRNIVILDFMFKSVTYFELVLVSRVTQELRFIFSHEMDIQLLQHQLLKRLSWHPWIVLVTLSKVNWLYSCRSISGLTLLFHWFITHLYTKTTVSWWL